MLKVEAGEFSPFDSSWIHEYANHDDDEDDGDGASSRRHTSSDDDVSAATSFISEGSEATLSDVTSSERSVTSDDEEEPLDSDLSEASSPEEVVSSDESRTSRDFWAERSGRRRVAGRGGRIPTVLPAEPSYEHIAAEMQMDEESPPQSSSWVLYHDSVPDKNLNRKAYAASIDLIGTLETDDDLRTFAHYIELEFVQDDFAVKQNLRLFRRGITPMWEDPQNSAGGRLIFWYGAECRKAVAVPAWRTLLRHLLHRSCDLTPISGVVLHVSKPRGVCIDVWTNTAALRRAWVAELQHTAFPRSQSVSFKPHHGPAPAPPPPPPRQPQAREHSTRKRARLAEEEPQFRYRPQGHRAHVVRRGRGHLDEEEASSSAPLRAREGPAAPPLRGYGGGDTTGRGRRRGTYNDPPPNVDAAYPQQTHVHGGRPRRRIELSSDDGPAAEWTPQQMPRRPAQTFQVVRRRA